MATGNEGQLNIDDYLVRLNKIFGDDLRMFFAYIQPIFVGISFVFSLLVLVTFNSQKEHKEQIGLRRLMSAITFLDMVSVVVRFPLPLMLSSSVQDYSDYMEFKFCENFIRLTSDVPVAFHYMTTLLKFGLVIYGIILVFLPSKEKVWLTSTKIVIFCIVASILGALTIIPRIYLTEFFAVDWVSKHDFSIHRTCCIILPRQAILKIDYRNVFLASTIVFGGLPMFLFVVCGLAIVVKVFMIKKLRRNSNNAVTESFKQKPSALAIACSLFAYAVLNATQSINFLFVTLIYGSVELYMTKQELQNIQNYVNVAITIADTIKAPLILLIFSCCDENFRSSLLCFIRCKYAESAKMENTNENVSSVKDEEKSERSPEDEEGKQQSDKTCEGLSTCEVSIEKNCEGGFGTNSNAIISEETFDDLKIEAEKGANL